MKPAELKNIIDKGNEVFLCDVRTKIEFQSRHLLHAQHIPLDDIESKESEGVFSKDKLIIFICKSGARSEKAMSLLKAAGYENVDHVEGGTDLCHKEGMEVSESKRIISLERQIRIVAGLLVLIGVILSITVNQALIGLSGFVGAGLVFAGVTNICGMELLLAKAPWNN